MTLVTSLFYFIDSSCSPIIPTDILACMVSFSLFCWNYYWYFSVVLERRTSLFLSCSSYILKGGWEDRMEVKEKPGSPIPWHLPILPFVLWQQCFCSISHCFSFLPCKSIPGKIISTIKNVFQKLSTSYV